MDKNKRSAELDCLRGIAVLAVVCYHYASPFGLLDQMFDHGCLGVELFFIISGFVIFLTIQRTNNYKDFIFSRFARLYPAYWVAVTFTALGIVVWGLAAKQFATLPSLKDYLVNLTMLQYYFKVRDIDGVYWTLAIELMFYGLMVILIVTGNVKRIRTVGYGAVLSIICYQTVVKLSVPKLYYSLWGVLPIVAYLPLFIAGIVFYKLKQDGAGLLNYLLLLLCFTAQILCYPQVRAHDVVGAWQYGLAILLLLGMFLLYVNGLLGFIVNRPLLYVGKISYSLYLIHSHLFYTFIIPFLTKSRHLHIAPAIAAFLIALPVAIGLATLINKFVEVPAMQYLKSKQQVANKLATS